MKATTIKWMDRKIGVPLCFFLSLLNSLLPRREVEVKKIAFIKLIEQGASVLAYSALKYSVEKYSKENVYFLVFKENRFILDQLDVLDEENIIEIRQDGLWHFLLDSMRAIQKLRSVGINACIDLEFFSRASAIFAFMIGATTRVGLHSFKGEQPYRGNLINHRLIYNPYLHVSKYYLLMVRAAQEKASKDPLLKIPSNSLKVEHPSLSIDENALERVASSLGLDRGRSILILNPNAGDMLPLRKWESHKFGELAKKINQLDPDIQILFTGIEKEKEAIERIMDEFSLSSSLNLAGKTTFPDLMALYELADLLITNDSGPAHFASLFSTQILVLFGPESPYLYAPLSDKVDVIYKNLACSPCVNVYNHRFSPCHDNVCMKSIEVDEVYEKAKLYLNKDLIASNEGN